MGKIDNLGNNKPVSLDNNGASVQSDTTSSANLDVVAAMSDLVDRTKNFDIDSTDKSPNKKTRYKLGQRKGDIRQIGSESVMSSQPQKTININGIQLTFSNTNTQASQYSDTTDNYIGDSRQDGRGDCYFMAEINAIRNTRDGQKVLTQNLKKHSDGSYTVTLPGAVKIRQQYKAKGLPCEVTGIYHISKAALEKAGNSRAYSKGDLEVVAFELAMEAYRAEMYFTNTANNTVGSFGTPESTISSQRIHENGGDLLKGGLTHDAAFILTGQKSDAFYANKKRFDSVEKYKDGQYGYITREEMARRTNADISMYREKGGVGISEFSRYTQNEQAINSMLNKYEGKEGQYALTFGVRVAQDGPDDATQKNDGHALTIVKITMDTVYIANPWHPDKIEPIPRDEFIKMTTSLVATPVKADNVSALTSNNGKISQNLLNQLATKLRKDNN